MDEFYIAKRLSDAGFIVNHYGNRTGRWFVGLGSHGDSAPTIKKAVKRCLRCCKIGKWWRLDYGKGGLAKDVAMEILNGA